MENNENILRLITFLKNKFWHLNWTVINSLKGSNYNYKYILLWER